MPKERKGMAVLGVLFVALLIVAGGVVVLLVGSWMSSHYLPDAAACYAFGQTSARCIGNESMVTAGQTVHAVGLCIIGVGVLLGVVMPVVVVRSSSSKTTGVPAHRRAVPARGTRPASKSLSNERTTGTAQGARVQENRAWTCPNCGAGNGMFRGVCLSCRAPRPQVSPPAQ